MLCVKFGLIWRIFFLKCHQCFYITVYRFLHYCIQVFTLLYAGFYITVCRFLHYCIQVFTLLFSGFYITVYRFLHYYIQVFTLLYTGFYITVYRKILEFDLENFENTRIQFYELKGRKQHGAKLTFKLYYLPLKKYVTLLNSVYL